MKLRNKHTGEVIEVNGGRGYLHTGNIAITFGSLKELNEKWEDYEERKKVYFINSEGEIREWSDSFRTEDWTEEKSIGNYFETKEEAEQTVEKLRAWKRLKDKGFRFDYESWKESPLDQIFYEWDIDLFGRESVKKDLDLLFSHEEGQCS